MTRPDSPEQGPAAGPAGKYSARDIARIFGDALPSQTRDDLPDPGSVAPPVSGSDGASDRWYRENRPPHHGG